MSYFYMCFFVNLFILFVKLLIYYNSTLRSGWSSTFTKVDPEIFLRKMCFRSDLN